MIITVDANILFSALITPLGRLAAIISNAQLPAQLVSGHYLIEELAKHHSKIVRYSKMLDQDVTELKRLCLNNVMLFDETIISEKNWIEAEALTILTLPMLPLPYRRVVYYGRVIKNYLSTLKRWVLLAW